jgi:ribosomal protein S18 acetylase RimI-like enzyme
MTTPDPAAIRALLNSDPVWAAYALADLQPAFEPYCEWRLAADGRGLALVFTGLSIPTFYAFGPAASVAQAMDDIELPARIYATVREEHWPVIERRFDFSADSRPMWRMAMPADAAIDPSEDPRLVRLTVEDSPRLEALYRRGGPFAPDAFDAYQVENGVFYGVVDEDGGLAAAGGTHIVDWTHGVAAIGNMYTRPDQRRRGHARLVIQALVAALQTGGVNNIVLNVDQRNAGARQLYAEFGFEIYCSYWEGIGVKRKM